MKVTKRQLRRIIKEEKAKLLEEQITPGEEGMAVNYKLEELEEAIAAIRNPEVWAEKYSRSLQGFLDNVDLVIKVMDRMR
jgi:hypothetical protein